MKQIRSCIEVLNDQDLERLHQATLEVLSRVGCRLPHKRVLDLMQQREKDMERKIDGESEWQKTLKKLKKKSICR